MDHTVTVIIPTFNRANYICESLASVLAQTVPPAQVIVVNDGSTDDTETVLQPYRDRILYLAKENGGKSTALNLALRHATGDFVWVFDDDDVAFPNALALHLEAFAAKPSAGFSFSPYFYGHIDSVGRLTPQRLRSVPDPAEGDVFLSLITQNFTVSQSVLVRRSAYEAVGPYNEAFHRSQDFDMSLRLAYRFPAARVSEPTFLFRLHDGVRGPAGARFDNAERNAKWRAFNRVIFDRLRGELALHEYLPACQRTADLSPSLRRLALLGRMRIMARKGLWEGFFEDLSAYLDERGGALATAEELPIIESALLTTIPLEDLASDRAILKRLMHMLVTHGARDLILPFWRPLYHQMVNDVKRRYFKDAYAGCLINMNALASLSAARLRHAAPARATS